MKKINKVLSLLMVYLLGVTFIPSSLTSIVANAQTSIPKYLQTQDGYLHNMYQYKDISVIQKDTNYDYTGYKIKNGKVQKYSDGYFHIYGQNQISQFDNIVDIETGKIINTSAAIKSNINKLLKQNSYTEKDLLSNSFMKNEFGNPWQRLALYKNNKYEIAYITDKGKFVKETTDIAGGYSAETTNSNGLFQWKYFFNQKQPCFVNITSAGAIKKYSIEVGKSSLKRSSMVQEIFENSGIVFVKYVNYTPNGTSTYVDKFKINKDALVFNNNIKQSKNESIEIAQDIKGNLWTVEKGYVSKLVDNSWVKVYQVDTKMTDMDIYDENHMILAYSEMNKVDYSITGRYTIINNTPQKK